jgi:hypothetical protein
MQQNDATSWRGGVVFLTHCRDCSQSVPTIRSLSQEPTDRVSGPKAYSGSSVTYMSLHLATLACGKFNWQGVRSELRQPITFEEV